jgi:hypothetical protein
MGTTITAMPNKPINRTRTGNNITTTNKTQREIIGVNRMLRIILKIRKMIKTKNSPHRRKAMAEAKVIRTIRNTTILLITITIIIGMEEAEVDKGATIEAVMIETLEEEVGEEI